MFVRNIPVLQYNGNRQKRVDKSVMRNFGMLSLLGEIGWRGATMYAVIETGGKQYKVPGRRCLFMEKLSVSEERIYFDKVLAYRRRELLTGNPVEGYRYCKVLGHGKGKKIIVFKYKPKKLPQKQGQGSHTKVRSKDQCIRL